MTETQIDPRKIEYVPLSSLKADPRNPKAHDQDVIDDSIGRFGMLDLIVQDQRTGNVVSGHGRRKALTAMESRGESAPEGVKVAEDGSWLVPVVTGWASRTDAEAGAALIALNRTTELGGWDDDALLSLLDDLEELDDGLVGVGFGESDLEDLRSYLDGVETAYNPPEVGEISIGGDEDGEGDEIGTIELRGDQVVVNVVVAEADRAQLYDVLKDLEFVIDARDSRGA